MTETNQVVFEGRTPYEIWLLDDQYKRIPGESVRLPGFFPIFQLAGLSVEDWNKWNDKYGHDSLGQGDNGELIMPEFPILGNLIDVLVNPLLLTPSECSELVVECSRLDERARDPVARKILDVVRTMASRASLRKLFMMVAAP